MSGQDYELGRVDERLNVDSLLRDALRIINRDMTLQGADQRRHIEKYIADTAKCVEHATALGWYPKGTSTREIAAQKADEALPGLGRLVREGVLDPDRPLADMEARLDDAAKKALDEHAARKNVLPGNATITCPKCATKHNRGPVNGVDVYRCLNCGDFYRGPSVRTLNSFPGQTPTSFDGRPMTKAEQFAATAAHDRELQAAQRYPAAPPHASPSITELAQMMGVPPMLECVVAMLRMPTLEDAELVFCRDITFNVSQWLQAKVDALPQPQPRPPLEDLS